MLISTQSYRNVTTLQENTVRFALTDAEVLTGFTSNCGVCLEKCR